MDISTDNYFGKSFYNQIDTFQTVHGETIELVIHTYVHSGEHEYLLFTDDQIISRGSSLAGALVVVRQIVNHKLAIFKKITT